MSTRVLHILHSMNRGGAENALMNYYRHVDRSLVQFDFLITQRLKCSFEDEIESLGGKVYRVPLPTLSNPFTYIKALVYFFKHHKEYKIVHSHTSSKSFIPLFIAKLFAVPVRISHSHNTKSENGYKGIIRNCLKVPLKLVATHYFSCGIEAAKWLYGEKFYNKGRVTIMRNVIESERFAFNDSIRLKFRKLLGIDDNSFLFGCVARFNHQKNHSFLIDIFASVKKQQPNSKLLLLGEGELEKLVRKKVAQMSLQDDVIFAGVVPNVSDYEQAMDAFLMPSFYEGLPLSLIEAQISGLPCFISDVITKEADLTGLVKYLPTNMKPEDWASAILSSLTQNRMNRRSYLDEIKQGGYDATLSSKYLQDFYLHIIG